jgi:REP element-mobilizing transposase RayT
MEGHLNDPATPVLIRIGHIIDWNRNNIPNQFSEVTIDEYVIIPSHIHGILVIKPENKGDAAASNVTLLQKAKFA